jgi:SSS family solute:Na+ symporter
MISLLIWGGSKLSQPSYRSTFQFVFSGQHNVAYWKGRHGVGAVLIVLMIVIYLVFSPLGIAQ